MEFFTHLIKILFWIDKVQCVPPAHELNVVKSFRIYVFTERVNNSGRPPFPFFFF